MGAESAGYVTGHSKPARNCAPWRMNGSIFCPSTVGNEGTANSAVIRVPNYVPGCSGAVFFIFSAWTKPWLLVAVEVSEVWDFFLWRTQATLSSLSPTTANAFVNKVLLLCVKWSGDVQILICCVKSSAPMDKQIGVWKQAVLFFIVLECNLSSFPTVSGQTSG